MHPPKLRYCRYAFSFCFVFQLSCSQTESPEKKDDQQKPDVKVLRENDSSKKVEKPNEAAVEPEAAVEKVVEKVVEPEAPVKKEETVYQILKPKDEIVSYLTATEMDKIDIGNCLFNLTGHPFELNSGALTFRRIEFDKITGTLAIALNDDKPTEQPQIVLIRALSTIGSDLIFHLMNPKAYYCFKNTDEVGTDYQIHLHCAAKISENIPWTDTKYKSALPAAVEDSGVYLSPGKSKNLTHERPVGAACLPGR